MYHNIASFIHLVFTCSIVVAASNEVDGFYHLSNYGDCVDIIAPVRTHTHTHTQYLCLHVIFYMEQGEDIRTTTRNGGSGVASGKLANQYQAAYLGTWL